MPTRTVPSCRTALGALATVSVLVVFAAAQAWTLAFAVRAARRLVASATPFARAEGSDGSILVLGDSTAVGVGASRPEASLAGRLGADHPAHRIVNRGRVGARVADAAGDAERALGERIARPAAAPSNTSEVPRIGSAGAASIDRPEDATTGVGRAPDHDLVVVCAGGNDVLRGTPGPAFRRDVDRLLDAAGRLGRVVVWLAPANVGLSPPIWPPLSALVAARGRRVAAAVVDAIARRADARFIAIDSWQRGGEPLADGAARVAADGLHPSDASYAAVARRLDASLAKPGTAVAVRPT